MFVFALFTIVLLLNGNARGDEKDGETIAATAKADLTEATPATEATEPPSVAQSKGGRHLGMPPPRLISGKSYVWSAHESFPGRSYNENQSTHYQLKQLPHQTIYYHGPVGRSKSQIQRFREFAMKNSHHVKNAGVYGSYGESSQSSSQRSRGFENQLNGGGKEGVIGRESSYYSIGESNDVEAETSNPIEQFFGGEITSELPQRPGERIQWGYGQGGSQSQSEYSSHLFGSSRSETTSHPRQGGSQSHAGFPSRGNSQTGHSQRSVGQSETGHMSEEVGNGQTLSGYPQRPGIGPNANSPYPSGSQTLSGLQGGSQLAYPQQGTIQSEGGYPQRPTSRFVHSQSGSVSQTSNSRRPGGGQYQTGFPQKGVSYVENGYPQRPLAETTQGGNHIKSGYGFGQPGGSRYQQRNNQSQASGYPQRPMSGQGSFGYPQLQGGSQNQGWDNQRPGSGQQGSNQQSDGSKNQSGHPQTPGSGQYVFNQRPGNGQTQTGSFQNGGSQIETGHPQKPLIGQQGSNQHQVGFSQRPTTNQNESGSSQQQAGNQSQSGLPLRPGSGDYGSTEYPQKQESTQNQGSYNRRPVGGQYGSSQKQGSYPQRPGASQIESGLTQQQGINQISGNYLQNVATGQYGSTQQNHGASQIAGGYPKKTIGGQTQTGYLQQQGGYIERPSNGQGEQVSQQQGGNKIQGGYLQRPGSGQFGSSQPTGGSPLQGKYPQKPMGGTNQHNGGSHGLDGQVIRPGGGSSSQRPDSGQSGVQYPQRPVSGQYGSTQQQINNQMKGSGYPQRPIGQQMQSGFMQQRPGSLQGQYGSQHQGGSQMQAGYPSQSPGIGLHQGNEGDGSEIGMEGNGTPGSGGSFFGTGGSGLTTNDRLRQYCKAPLGQFASESCNKFVNCWDDVVIEQECGGVLLFNEEKSYCDYPENVDCGGRVTSSPSMGMEGESSCPSSFATYRSNYDCGEFIVCAHGIAHRFHCAGGLAYNDTLGVCDYPRNVDCTGIPLLPYPEEESPSETEGDTKENGIMTEGSSYGEIGATTESTDSGLWNYRESKKNRDRK